jgi:hypothetical protein
MRMSLTDKPIKRLSICAIACFFFGLGASFAVDAQENVFMSDFIISDFDGEGAARQGRVLYTDSKPDETGACECSVPRENFDPRGDPVVIVSGPGTISGHVVSKDNATYDVLFRVIAVTKGEGEYVVRGNIRRIIPLDQPEFQHVIYHLRLIEREWYVVDPPLPRVSVDVVINMMKKELTSLRKVRDLSEEQLALTRYFNSQLTILESLPL